MDRHAGDYASARYHGSRAYAAGSHASGSRQGFYRGNPGGPAWRTRHKGDSAPADDHNFAYWGFH